MNLKLYLTFFHYFLVIGRLLLGEPTDSSADGIKIGFIYLIGIIIGVHQSRVWLLQYTNNVD
jgi:hypothetical protein